MFQTFQEACTAKANSCNITTVFKVRDVNTVSVGTYLYIDSNATVLAGTGFIFKDNFIYEIVAGRVQSITTCP